MINNSSFRKIFFAAVVAIFVAVALFNWWIGQRLTVIDESLKPSAAAAPVVSSSSPAHSYGSNVLIDPSNDPLAPRPKTVKPRPAIQAASEGEHRYPGGILVQ